MPTSLNKKLALFYILLGGIFVSGSYAVLRLTVYPAFAEFERESAARDLARAERLFEDLFERVAVMNGEYSFWNQTYDYVLGRRPSYAEENLQHDLWTALDIDMMLVYGQSAELLGGMFVDPRTDELVDPAIGIYWDAESRALLTVNETDKPLLKGLVNTAAGPMMVVSGRVTTTDTKADPVGRLLNGLVLTQRQIDALAETARAELRLHVLDDAGLAPEYRQIASRLVDGGAPRVERRGEDMLHQFVLISDLAGEPLAVLEVATTLQIARIGMRVMSAATVALVLAAIVFLAAALLLVQRLVLKPVRRLTDAILRIRETGDLSIDPGTFSNDELGALATEFRTLAAGLDRANADLVSARDAALESARAKGEFLARMSHEIRTPMNGVLGMTELLRDTPLDPQQNRLAETIAESGNALLLIIDDILDFSKIEAGRMTLDPVDTDLRRLLEDTIDSIAISAATKKLALIGDYRFDTACALRVDPGRLRQVLTNLLGNAVKFTGEGEVVLSVSCVAETDADIQLEFQIRDTGIGIRPENLEEIFNSFSQEDGSTTRRYGGSGLGLAIARQLLQLMGSELHVDSTHGVGSTFHFSLRLEKGARLERTATVSPEPLSGKRILVADRQQSFCAAIEAQLLGWGAQPVTATSADAALGLLDDAARRDAPIEIAIIDADLCCDSGQPLTEAARERSANPAMKLVAVHPVTGSANAGDGTIDDRQVALARPVRRSMLLEAVVTERTGSFILDQQAGRGDDSAGTLDGHILLVEDNPVNQRVATGMLEKMGLRTTIAGDGVEALARVAEGTFDLILMDCQMPRMDGFEATRAIRNMASDAGQHRVPIIALTANALDSDRERCIAAGMDAYLRKPFRYAVLYETLSQHLAAHSDGASTPEPRNVGHG